MLRFALILSLILATPAPSAERSAGGFPVVVEKMVDDLRVPWSIAFLPGCELLITERVGNLLHIGQDGRRSRVAGVPDVHARGQGGLLDVAVPRDFAATRQVLLSHARRQRGGTGTALSVGRLAADGGALTGVKLLFEMAPGSDGGRHFGSRVVEAIDGRIFMTTGDRGDRPSAQDLSGHNGKVIRINRDGSVPDDNPFVGIAGSRPEIWSFGHRNPQGAGLDLEGRLWISEHGARGGDEINRIEAGRNYGWPVISYGVHYSGRKIGEGVAMEGMEQPSFHWDPSIAPSGLLVYSGRLWNEWRGHLFVGSLKSDFISRIDPLDGFREVERIRFPETRRVRDVREAPDGTIWFLSEDRGSAYRIVPADAGPEPVGGCRFLSRHGEVLKRRQ